MKTNELKNRAAAGPFIRPAVDAVAPAEPEDLSRFEGEGRPEAPSEAAVPESFRRLKWNEVVRHGDFITDERLRLEPWEGPGGFRADTFVKTIFRRKKTGRLRPAATGKSK